MKYVVDSYCQEAQKFFKDLALQLGQPDDLDHAFRVIRAVFHTLRGRIIPQESMHVVSQLPLLLKGIYVDGWDISKPLSQSRTMDGFLDDLRNVNRSSGGDFAGDDTAKDKIRAVFNALRQYVDDGEIRHVVSELPKEVAEVLT